LRFAERRPSPFNDPMARMAEGLSAARRAERRTVWMMAIVLVVLFLAFSAWMVRIPLSEVLPTGPGPINQERLGRSWPGWQTLFFGAAIFLVCIVVMVVARSMVARAVAGAIAISAPLAFGVPATLSLLKDGTLLKIEHVHLNYSSERKTPDKQPDQPPTIERPVDVYLGVNINQTEGTRPPVPGPFGNVEFVCRTGEGPMFVGTFESGRHDAFEMSKDFPAQTVDQVVAALVRLKEQRNLVGVVLIGSADKTHLLPKTEIAYDSNAGLAQARALYVKKAFESDSHLTDLKTIITLAGAPTQLGPTVDIKSLARDRIVSVCAMFQPAQSK
jgi:hypothetical protein